uniref:Succinate:cytochrome c oxidoreductase subunit 3 n=1 Tax=Gelidium vagum TaxID=35171 RepID=V5JFX2_GELVA|nr:succinate:cytochrome c oxidoreductase subunit 3 [Gelidium vagum]AGO19317.1 succinate:cytochrome c oxidoreductase subunit 3 [Gelidium vagum]
MLQYFLFLNRPLSPHLTIYAPQLSSLSSIWHRLSGIFISIAFILEINFINSLLSSNLQNLISVLGLNLTYDIKKLLIIFIITVLIYHLLSGLRYLIWDLGFFLHQNFLIFFTAFIGLVFLSFIFFNLLY